MSHCDFVKIDSAAKKEDGPWYNNEVGATKICTLSIGVKLYTIGGVGPYFPLWMELIPQLSKITEETKVGTMPL